jgi:starch phosphorylase
MLLADLRAYIQTQERVDTAYQDRRGWLRKAILNVARAGKFSSDRTIAEYASQIWHVAPCPIVPRTPEGGPDQIFSLQALATIP